MIIFKLIILNINKNKYDGQIFIKKKVNNIVN